MESDAAHLHTPSLIIDRIDTALVPPRWGLLRILTRDGLEGFGEFTLEGQLECTQHS